jgi:hypothetical protein
MRTSRISSPPANPKTAAPLPPQGRENAAVTRTTDRPGPGDPVAGSDAGAVEYASWLRLLRRPSR